jgi:uncharacterized protein YbaA (DUF1428 family)
VLGVIETPLENSTSIGAGMAHYIDGFVLPISRRNLDEYKRLVEPTAEIWREHGALDYREYVSEGLMHEGTRSFIELSGAAEDEVVIFGWVEFESREARDRANAKVAADPRMAELIESSSSGFDAKRMAYGAFREFFLSSIADARAGSGET